jgi:hypothetical protein
MCEFDVTCDVCMLNHVQSWLYIVESLKSIVISRTTGFIWAQVRQINCLGSGFSTRALINWTVLLQF